MIKRDLGKIDCFGLTRKHPSYRRRSDRFVIADIRPAMIVHKSSDEPSETNRVFGSSQGQLLVIADGVGERASAARASAVAIDTLNDHLLSLLSIPTTEDAAYRESDLFQEFSLAIEECQRAMQQEVDAADRFRDMGAVLTMVYLDWPHAYVAHVGNNRAYHWRQCSVDQVTEDHTMARRLVDAGKLSPSRAETSPLKNVVWNLVGTQIDHVRPQCENVKLQIGDALVLCSDGMASAIRRPEVGDALEQTDSAQESCESIFEIADARGLDDDATVVVARFRKPTDPTRFSEANTSNSSPPSCSVKKVATV